MKEYTFEEVISKIEPGQKYICTSKRYLLQSIEKHGGFICINGKEFNNELVVHPDSRYILRKQSVELKVALDEYRYKHKTIESELDGVIMTYKYKQDGLRNENGYSVSASEILDGKWYIKED